MAKEVEGSHEPSQSSSTLPPLAENEVELVIERFWRDTRPRVCVRSETKQVNGFNFRLLVWPQGSKQSQSHLSAFVEVVPPSSPALEGKKESGQESSSSSSPGVMTGAKKPPYPPDWACPCVFYRISVMNFKQKYPYSKADTWTFSYVCPDRGWHTLLDTRYINRRDGYLSNEGSLVIRAIAFPRFGHPISVLPLLSSIGHQQDERDSAATAEEEVGGVSSVHHRFFGLANFMATDHVNCLIQTLFNLPGFRKAIYLMRRKGKFPVEYAVMEDAELEVIEQGLESCVETVKEIMTRVSNASPEVSRQIQHEFIKDCMQAGFCGKTGVGSRMNKIINMYGRCRVLISCLEESLFSVSQSLFGRKRSSVSAETLSKRSQFEAYRQIVRECKRILCTVVQSLFLVSSAHCFAEDKDENKQKNLIEELQLIFAQLEYGQSAPAPADRLIDTRGFLRELGLTDGGILSAASPDGLFIVFFDALKKVSLEMEGGGAELWRIFCGKFTQEEETHAFSHLRLNNQKATSVDKHISSWLKSEKQEDEVDNSSSSSCYLEKQQVRKFEEIPMLLTLQFSHKVKDRLDVSERLSLRGPDETVSTPVTAQASSPPYKIGWKEFLDHACCGEGEEDCCAAAPASVVENNFHLWEYRLHAIQFVSGELLSGHYSVMVRNHRIGGWTRFDDAYVEELIDVSSSSSSSSPSSNCPDWVFSPEWSCSSVCFVREDAVDFLYQRGVDVRILRPDLFTAAVELKKNYPSIEKSPVLCNRRRCSVSSPTCASSSLDASCQVEVSLITEKDVIGAAPGGFTVPFTFSVPNVSRKLIVRKDIPIERLMQAVGEHFKIPVHMQRLFALRYYPETGQERFELMQSCRAVIGYLPLEQSAVGKDRSSRKSSCAWTSGSAPAPSGAGNSSLYVLVSRGGRENISPPAISVWVKVLDETQMGVVSVGFLALDPNEPLRSYFDQVIAKTSAVRAMGSLVAGTQFIVFEEVSPRQVEIKRTSSLIKNEKIQDGDILIFVPLTDSAKRALVTPTAVLLQQQVVSGCKRRILLASTNSHSSKQLSEQHGRFLPAAPTPGEDEEEESLSSADEDEDHEETSSCCSSQSGDLNERCKRFLSRANKNEGKKCCSSLEECSCEESRYDIVRRYFRSQKEVVVPKIADIMSDIMREFDGEEEILAIKRRLEVPQELKEELSRVAASMCFYCQLPLGAAGPRPSAKVTCSAGCVTETLTYHARCVQELVCETGSSACIITEGCSGKISVEPKSLVAKLLTREEPVRMSTAALRAKVGKMLEMPPVPEVVEKTGQVVVRGVPVQWKGKGKLPPAIPSSISKVSKKKVSKKQQIGIILPLESLWWNACLIAFGGMDNLHTVVADQHWDASEMSQARAIFNVWCKSLLEKHHPVASKRVAAIKGNKTSANIHKVQKEETVMERRSSTSDEQDDSSDDGSSDVSEDSKKSTSMDPEPSSLTIDVVPSEFAFSDDDDDHSGNTDDGEFILVAASSKKEKKRRTPCIETPTDKTVSVAHTPPPIVIPPGLFGTFTDDENKDDIVKNIPDADSANEADVIVLPTTATISLVDALPPSSTCALLESRMNLLPLSVRQYCLPVQLVFVYYSEQFFATLVDHNKPTTVSIIPPPGGEEAVKTAITLASYKLSLNINRLFTSPQQLFPDSNEVSVQWFVDFESVTEAHRFTQHVSSAYPDWGPETGALLPASLLGFAV